MNSTFNNAVNLKTVDNPKDYLEYAEYYITSHEQTH